MSGLHSAPGTADPALSAAVTRRITAWSVATAAVLIALAPKAERSRKPRRERAGGAVNPFGDPLFEALRALRRDLAAEAGLPPYVIFHDSTLREMATARPASMAALGELGGVGTRKLEAYGEAFLGVIRQY